MKKMLPWLISLLLAITLIAIVVIYFWTSMFGDQTAKSPEETAKNSVENVQAQRISADDLSKVTSELINIKTNLADTDYIVMISFAFQLENEKTKTEFDKIKDIKIKPIVNRALWVMTPEDMRGTKGKDQLTASLINAVNAVLLEGKLTSVDITEFIITPI